MNNYFQLLDDESKNDFNWISPLINLPINGLNTKTNFEYRLIKFKFIFGEKINDYLKYKYYQKLLYILKFKFIFNKKRKLIINKLNF
jgi:hypothetical protein